MIEIIRKSFLVVFVLSLASAVEVMAQEKLTGIVIGTTPSINYDKMDSTRTENTLDMAFDGHTSTFFAAYQKNNAWVGLDLGKPHIITRVGACPRNHKKDGPKRQCLAVIEGANSPDFSDAVPLQMFHEYGVISQITYLDVNVSRGFRYVRYVGPNNSGCNIGELEFYGYPGEGDDSHFYQLTNLPTVVISTEGAEEPYDKEHNLNCFISVISEDGKRLVCDTGKVRLRGNSSLHFPKKPYRIKFDSKHRPLADSPAKDKKWTLVANYDDKTLMRNLLAFRLSQYLGFEYTPYGQPVDVIVNGEYKGNFQLCDQIEPGKGRVPIDKDVAGSYLVEVDKYAPAEPELSQFSARMTIPVSIKFPDSDDITEEEHNAIVDAFNVLTLSVNKIKDGDYTSYLDNLDIESFLRYVLMGEFTANPDTYYSIYMYKNPADTHWMVGPVWDYNLAFDNDTRLFPTHDIQDYIYNYLYTQKISMAGQIGTFVSRIMNEDPATAQRLSNVWTKARNYGLNAENLNAFVDSLAQVLYASQELNFKRWDLLNSKVFNNPQALGTYEAEVDVLHQYIDERVDFLDEKIGLSTGMNSQMSSTLGQNSLYDLQGRIINQSYIKSTPGIYIQGRRKLIHK